MIKTIIKLLVAVCVYTVIFMIANAVLPFSAEFAELKNSTGNPAALLYLLFNNAWICFTIFYIIKNSNYPKMKMFISILFVMFFIQPFLVQIETLLFSYAFITLSKMDIIFIMAAGFLPLAGVLPLLFKFFYVDSTAHIKNKLLIKDAIIKIGLIVVIYLCIYMLFGYFVAWQFKELRLFYTGSIEKLSFFGQMENNLKNNPVIIPFQILRGILFGLAIIPIKKMFNKNKINFIICVCLIYLSAAIVLIIPNVLFPNIVRIAHLIEMCSSMLLFGIIAGVIIHNIKNKNDNNRPG